MSKDNIVDEIMNAMMVKRRYFFMNSNASQPAVRIYVSREVMRDLLYCDSFYAIQDTKEKQRQLNGIDLIVMENDGYHICVEHPNY